MAEYWNEIEAQVLVLLGNFNPAIIQPAWLAHYGLIRQEESDNAKIEIIRPEISIFSVGSVRLITQTETFQIETSAVEEGPTIKDLAIGIFGILEHTPLTSLGINRDMHFKIAKESTWHKAGHRLVPKDLWGNIMEEPGTRSITVEDNTSKKHGRLKVRVEPSTKTIPGIYIGTNLHFSVDRPAILAVLEEFWDKSQVEARKAADTIMKFCVEG